MVTHTSLQAWAVSEQLKLCVVTEGTSQSVSMCAGCGFCPVLMGHKICIVWYSVWVVNALNFKQLQTHKVCQHHRMMKSCCKPFSLQFFTETLPLTYFKCNKYFPRGFLVFPALLLVPDISARIFCCGSSACAGIVWLIWLQAAEGAAMALTPAVFQIITIDPGWKAQHPITNSLSHPAPSSRAQNSWCRMLLLKSICTKSTYSDLLASITFRFCLLNSKLVFLWSCTHEILNSLSISTFCWGQISWIRIEGEAVWSYFRILAYCESQQFTAYIQSSEFRKCPGVTFFWFECCGILLICGWDLGHVLITAV